MGVPMKKPMSYFQIAGLSTLAVLLSFLSAISPFFLWISLIPLFFLALFEKRSVRFLFIFLAYCAGNFLQIYYTYYHTIFPYQNTLLPVALDSLFFTGILWLSAVCIDRLKWWASVFAYPMLWTSYEYLSITFASHGAITWLPIFSQVEFLPIVQIVSITGILGLSFLTSLFPSVVATTFYYWKQNRKQALWSLISAFIIFLMVFTFGLISLQSDSSSPSLKVALLAKDPHDIESYLADREKDPISQTKDLASIITKMAHEGAQYILLPENALWITQETQDSIFNIIANVARENHIFVFVPCSLTHRVPERNALFVFGPDGKLLASYNKMHLVSPFEDSCMPGDELSTIDLEEGLAGLAICRDMDFVNPTKEYSKRGVGIMFVPARDFGPHADGIWHAEVAILQSISGGFSLARSAGNGYLSATDSKGRILAWHEVQPDQVVSSIVKIPLSSGRSFYSRTGDWFPLINCLGALAFLLAIIRCYLKKDESLKNRS
jgi:apolipoprotein N-acyltransferase